MDFVVDESVERQNVARLRVDGHNVLSIAETAAGSSDRAVLTQANSRDAVLVTEDKDFGELVYREGLVSSGVLLVRLGGLPPDSKAAIVSVAIRVHSEALRHVFAVISPGLIRFRRAFQS